MNRSVLVISLLVAATALPIAISARRLESARDQVRGMQATLTQTKSEAREIAQLREVRETIQAKPKPTHDVITQVTAALAEVGIPERALKNLTPQSDVAVRTSSQGIGGSSGGGVLSGALREQTLQLSLSDVSPGELGHWLVQWRSMQSVWTPMRLELVHVRETDGDTNRYDATIMLCALYLDGRAADSSGVESRDRSEDGTSKESS